MRRLICIMRMRQSLHIAIFVTLSRSNQNWLSKRWTFMLNIQVMVNEHVNVPRCHLRLHSPLSITVACTHAMIAQHNLYPSVYTMAIEWLHDTLLYIFTKLQSVFQANWPEPFDTSPATHHMSDGSIQFQHDWTRVLHTSPHTIVDPRHCSCFPHRSCNIGPVQKENMTKEKK